MRPRVHVDWEKCGQGSTKLHQPALEGRKRSRRGLRLRPCHGSPALASFAGGFVAGLGPAVRDEIDNGQLIDNASRPSPRSAPSSVGNSRLYHQSLDGDLCMTLDQGVNRRNGMGWGFTKSPMPQMLSLVLWKEELLVHGEGELPNAAWLWTCGRQHDQPNQHPGRNDFASLYHGHVYGEGGTACGWSCVHGEVHIVPSVMA